MRTDEPPRQGPLPDGRSEEPPEFEPLHAPGLADLPAPTAAEEARRAGGTTGPAEGDDGAATGRRRATAAGGAAASAVRPRTLAVALLLAGAAAAVFLVQLELRSRESGRPELPVAVPVVAPPRPAPPVVTPAVAAPAPPVEAPAGESRRVPRLAEGVPVTVTLSSVDHGLDLRRAGLSLQREGARPWTVATAPSPGKIFPPYAALYAAEFDGEGALLDVRLVTRRPLTLRGEEARVFIALPMHRPDRGSFDLLVRRGQAQPERRHDVYVDTVTPIEEQRFFVAGLSPQATYTVRASTGGPPVLVVAGRPLSAQHIQQPRADQPLDQQLLQPGQTTSLTAATSVAFVVPTVAGAPERHVTVELYRAGTSPASAAREISTPGRRYAEGQAHLARGDAVSALESFRECLLMEPTHEGCSSGVGQALAQQHQ